LQEVLQAGATDLWCLQQGVVCHFGENHQALLGQELPSLHRAEGDEIVFRLEHSTGKAKASSLRFVTDQ
jgi:hypothetical protein